MENKTDTKRERLKAIFIKYELDKEDVFTMKLGGRSIPIITRTGVEKIMAKKKIKLKYDVVVCERDYCAVKCYATLNEVTIETFATAQPKNCKSTYYLEMAEKRAKARAILQITEFSLLGIYSEVESDEFKQQEPKQNPVHKKVVDDMEQTMREYNGGM
tara:strand:- start:2222 stop:2698 length:477 start_codon:yes stop_codon:yes gene_type:complete